MLKSWTGNCAYFDANGNYLGMLPATLPDDPDDWVTGDTIYVKCLKAQPTQMASAMTDMAMFAGASTQGSILPGAFTVLNASIRANVSKGLLVIEGGGTVGKSTAPTRLSALNYNTRVLTRPKTVMRALDAIYDPSRVLFVFNGHGLNDIPGTPQTADGDKILIHFVGADSDFPCDQDDNAEPPTENIWLHWSEVTNKLQGQPAHYKFVFLNSCSCGSQYQFWMQAFKAKAFFGWEYPVLLVTAQSFDRVFWDEMLNPANDYKAHRIFTKTVARCTFFGPFYNPDGSVYAWDVPVYKGDEELVLPF